MVDRNGGGSSGLRKVLVIGLDSATMNLIQPWAEEGRLPNFARFFREGAYGRLESVPNMNSASAWSSLVTGKNPGKHGIFWFVEENVEDYGHIYVNASFRDGTAVWRILSEQGKSVGVINVPITYPAEEVNGFLIAGLDTPGVDAERFTYPPELYEELQPLLGEYTIEPGIPSLLKAGKWERAVQRLQETVAQRLAYTKYLMQNKPWDFFMVVFTCLDRAQHFYWKYMDPEGFEVSREERERFGEVIFHAYQQLDEVIGELVELAGEETTILLVSDHGMAATDSRNKLLPKWLESIDMLRYHKSHEALGSLRKRVERTLFNQLARLYRLVDRRFSREFKLRLARRFPQLRRRVERHMFYSKIDWRATRAYANGKRSEIWINLRGRQPLGIVAPGKEYEEVCDYIAQQLLSARDPKTGEPFVERVYRREELYSGRYVERSPDLLIRWKKAGHIDNLKLGDISIASIKEELKGEDPIIALGSGHHDLYGIVFIRGEGVKRGGTIQNAKIVDIAPTILYLMGQPISEDMDGRVLEEAFEEDYLVRHPMTKTTVAADEGSTDRKGFSQEDEKIISERLRGLGYVD